MPDIKPGDVVVRKSYDRDVFFKVVEVVEVPGTGMVAHVKGLDLRLLATAPLDDLEKVDQARVSEYWRACMLRNHEMMKEVFARRQVKLQRSLLRAMDRKKDKFSKIESFSVPGIVLHLDGDREYLDLCMTTYKQLGVPAHGYHIPEAEQAGRVVELLRLHRPDLLVITGHDGLIKGKDISDISSYHNSGHFVNAVKAARSYEKSRDDLVIFAGACQSHYEELLAAGANFASSPKRVLIHAFDPVFVVEKIAYTSIYDPISLKDVIAGTITGFDGIGGVETRGIHRLGLPKPYYDG